MAQQRTHAKTQSVLPSVPSLSSSAGTSAVMSAASPAVEPDIDVFTDKIGGHVFSEGAAAGIAKEKSSGRILKLVDGDERGRRELLFYQTVFHAERQRFQMLIPFLPEFLGLRTILNREFIVLEDVSCGNKNVMDVKIGSVTWDHLASDEKIQKEQQKYRYGQELGFRLLGYRVTDQTTGNVILFQKSESKLLSGSGMRQALDSFLSPNDLTARQRRRQLFLQQLYQLRDLMQQHLCRRFRFIASSLLFAYGPSVDSTEEQVRLTVIDFGHTFRMEETGEQLDQNYMKGLLSLISFVEAE